MNPNARICVTCFTGIIWHSREHLANTVGLSHAPCDFCPWDLAALISLDRYNGMIHFTFRCLHEKSERINPRTTPCKGLIYLWSSLQYAGPCSYSTEITNSLTYTSYTTSSRLPTQTFAQTQKRRSDKSTAWDLRVACAPWSSFVDNANSCR